MKILQEHLIFYLAISYSVKGDKIDNFSALFCFIASRKLFGNHAKKRCSIGKVDIWQKKMKHDTGFIQCFGRAWLLTFLAKVNLKGSN